MTPREADASLDNLENNSEEFWRRAKPFIERKRACAKRNNEWMRSRVMLNEETGEVLTDREGNVLSLEKMSKSWYLEQGARNNAFSVVKRAKKVFGQDWDVKRYRPKFITLTFSDVDESWRAKDALPHFLDNVRKFAKAQGSELLVYFWTAEVQMKNERGALHYHILILGCPFIPLEKLRSWWKFGYLWAEALDDVGRGFRYLAKYLWKWGKEADDVENLPAWWFLFSIWHKRRYGFSQWFALPPAERIPRWLKDGLQESGLLEHLEKGGRAEGGGWLLLFNRPYGKVEMHFASPFKILELTR